MADGAVWVESCAAADFNAQTMTCAAPVWTPQVSSFPTLSIADAQSIGLACALLWGTAWGIKQCARAVREIG